MIYNEVITVMNSIKVLKEKAKRDVKKKRMVMKGLSKDIIHQMAEAETDEGDHYVIEKTLLVEAWSKYRPSSTVNSPRHHPAGGGKSPRKKDFHELYGDHFLARLMAGTKVKKSGVEDDEDDDPLVSEK